MDQAMLDTESSLNLRDRGIPKPTRLHCTQGAEYSQHRCDLIGDSRPYNLLISQHLDQGVPDVGQPIRVLDSLPDVMFSRAASLGLFVSHQMSDNSPHRHAPFSPKLHYTILAHLVV